MRKLTLKEFINRSNKIHKNKYDYSLVVYKNQDTKILIICPIHGQFEQRPDHHLKGHECKLCSTKSQANIKLHKNASQNFIKEATRKWAKYYDYSKINYVTAKKSVIIICPKHGEFKQTPDAHLKHECLKCSIEKNAKKQLKTTSEFTMKAKLIHGDKFDYSKSVYTGNRNKIEIICSEHGSWWQTPYNHLQGKGCRLCTTNSKKEQIIENLFKSWNIKFIREKTFSNCINPKTGKKLRFDFYLPEHSLCIEYDGKQHFEAVDLWGGLSSLCENKFRDEIKNNFCKENNITLYRISYKQNLLRKLQLLFSKIISKQR